eukprot:TRINITY_DN236_c0_g1_i24.p2 TRINITY_DN236_c0_g1~~TRINITY_DN236_c0_g1_i24.p2  ORF type:complete len:157 (-),score=18.88 TRINITY_DN236_c0_g1_i24:151-621(-)
MCIRDSYYDLINVIQDERISRKMTFKFKNLAEVNTWGAINMAIFMVPPALALTYLFMGKAQRSHNGYKYQWTLFSVFYPISCWFGYTFPMPRRLYTEILTDPTDDGTYVRQKLRQSTPGLWRRISRQLFFKGYDFPEIHELTKGKTEFPTDFINRY